MKKRFSRPLIPWLTPLEPLACAAGFAFVSWLYSLTPGGAAAGVWSEEWTTGLAVSALICWLAMPFWQRGSSDAMRVWIEQFFTALGLILIMQSALAYFFLISPLPWWIVLAGTTVSIGSIAQLRRTLSPMLEHPPGGTLLLGFDTLAAALTPALGGELVGVIHDNPAEVPDGLTYLGGPERLAGIVAERHPQRIVVGEDLHRLDVSPRLLLQLRFAGVSIDRGMALYESVLGRVCWLYLDPEEMLFSSPLAATRSVMALQAIYTNLIGLALLLTMSPVLLIASLCVRLFSGGPALEFAECAGFQRIPFQLRRFRTRDANGDFTPIGRLLIRLRIANLPQLVNIVRGEMSLFGPAAPRREFADRLCQMMPMYSQRFLVKPGLLGWAQVNLRGTEKMADEYLRLEYDLYYVQRSSPSLDLEIFIRTIFQLPFAHYPAAEPGAAGTV
jgi:lipopolysaccharide/colanic/teichoic acid biosynthesis glycosyltransferase